jgi:antitoxin (DNA-binding transcriptional repressor) of toxin-antitoxin stability system
MNVLEAKTNFSKIIALLERKEENEVIVARAGKPVVKIVLYEEPKSFDQIFGIAAGKFTVPDDFDEPDDEIARMFGMID